MKARPRISRAYGEALEAIMELWMVIAVVAGWLAVSRWVLPALGVPT